MVGMPWSLTLPGDKAAKSSKDPTAEDMVPATSAAKSLDPCAGPAENAKDDKSPERRLATAMMLRTLVPRERAAEPDDFIRLPLNNG